MLQLSLCASCAVYALVSLRCSADVPQVLDLYAQDPKPSWYVFVLQVESVLNDFVRLREECSYHDSGTALEGGYGMAELMADDEDVYQLGKG
jgi:hypothetical protein